MKQQVAAVTNVVSAGAAPPIQEPYEMHVILTNKEWERTIANFQARLEVMDAEMDRMKKDNKDLLQENQALKAQVLALAAAAVPPHH